MSSKNFSQKVNFQNKYIPCNIWDLLMLKAITCLSEIQSQLGGHLVFYLINPAGQPEDAAPSVSGGWVLRTELNFAELAEFASQLQLIVSS